MFKKSRQKRKFTLIELIIVIVVIGVLAGMAIPKLIGVTRDAKVAAMIRDVETLEKTIAMEQIKNDTLPLYSSKENSSNTRSNVLLEKIVFAEEEFPLENMSGIYKSLKETLIKNEDKEEYLYKVNTDDIKNLKYGKGEDFYVYSTLTERVYYYSYLENSKGEYHHNEYGVEIENGIIEKVKSKKIEKNKEPLEIIISQNGVIYSDMELVFSYNDSEDLLPTWKVNGVVEDNPNRLYQAGSYKIELELKDLSGTVLYKNDKEFNVYNRPIEGMLGLPLKESDIVITDNLSNYSKEIADGVYNSTLNGSRSSIAYREHILQINFKNPMKLSGIYNYIYYRTSEEVEYKVELLKNGEWETVFLEKKRFNEYLNGIPLEVRFKEDYYEGIKLTRGKKSDNSVNFMFTEITIIP